MNVGQRMGQDAAPQEADAPGPDLSLVQHRSRLPPQVEGFFPRTALMQRLDPTQRRITALTAPGGFGKTALLVDACERIRKRGQIAAWLSVDGQEHPATLVGCIVQAFVNAGLPIVDAADVRGVGRRLRQLLQSVEQHGSPCVLALDDLDRCSDESLALLDQMLRDAPANLHLAVACRELPQRLNIAPWILDGQGTVGTVEELRFGRHEVAGFFGGKLSSRKVADLLRRSQGWPLALRLERNCDQLGRPPEESQETARNWMTTQMLQGLTPDERQLVQDIGLFDRIDTHLLDGVLGPGTMKRLVAMPMLAGLLQPIGSSGAVRLHGLIRDACSEQVYGDDPGRFRAIHRRIAETLAGRGDVFDAMRHAIAADDVDLAARVFEDAGAVRLGLRFGFVALQRADSLLTPRMLHGHPRLVLARAALLAAGGQLDKALHLQRNAGLDDESAGEDAELAFDALVVEGLRSLYLCGSVSSTTVQGVVAAWREHADDPGLEPLLRGVMRYGLAVFEHQHGRLDEARDWIDRSQRDLLHASEYMWMYASLQEGAIEFARGRVDDAARAYKRAFDVCRRKFFHSGPRWSWKLLDAELHLERNEMASLAGWSVELELIGERGGWLDVYLAAASVTAELAMMRGDVDEAVAGLRKGLEFASRTGRTTLVRALAAQCAGAYVRAGRTDDAKWLWRHARLPTDVEECAQLGKQTWREMEWLCRARAWLLLAEGDLPPARALADAFVATARNSKLRRSLAWALVLSAAIEGKAGDTDRAMARLAEYRTLLTKTGYRHALICLQSYIRPLLAKLRAQDAHLVDSLAAVLQRTPIPTDPEPGRPHLSARELQVLRRLRHSGDKEIATALGMGVNGVRYHVRNIFRKLNVRDRNAAVRRADEFGVPNI